MIECPICHNGMIPNDDDPHGDNPERECELCRGQAAIDPAWHKWWFKGELEQGECQFCGHLAYVTKARRQCYRCWMRAHKAGIRLDAQNRLVVEPAPF